MDNVSVLFSCDKDGNLKSCRVYTDEARANEDLALVKENDESKAWRLESADFLGKRKRNAKN